LDDVKIQRKTITFTKNYTFRTIFINKMINSGNMRMFNFFYNFYIYIFYFVSEMLCINSDSSSSFSMRYPFFFIVIILFFVIATFHIVGWNFCSYVWVGKSDNSYTTVGIPTHTRVCLEVNTHTGTLDYFINNKHIKDRVVNVPKDVYFGVWNIICYFYLFIDMKIL
jgi:hypothetical protein